MKTAFLGLAITTAFALSGAPVVEAHGSGSGSSSGSGHGGSSGGGGSCHSGSGFHGGAGFSRGAASGGYGAYGYGYRGGRSALISPFIGQRGISGETITPNTTAADFGGRAAAVPQTRATQRANNSENHPAGGWNRNQDRIWHGRHYHWNNGAWAVIGDGYYPWDDSYYAPVSSDDYPAMSEAYDNDPAAIAANAAHSLAAQVQARLAHEGYFHGEVNGMVGVTTRDAIADYQKDNDLPVTGYVTKSLLDALRR